MQEKRREIKYRAHDGVLVIRQISVRRCTWEGGVTAQLPNLGGPRKRSKVDTTHGKLSARQWVSGEGLGVDQRNSTANKMCSGKPLDPSLYTQTRTSSQIPLLCRSLVL